MSFRCVVSGGEDIRATAESLRAGGFDVVCDDDVDPDATSVLVAGGRFMVVAHGDIHGEITLHRSSSGRHTWLWIDMPAPPKGARVYLYACHGGQLVPYLTDCEAFGHSGTVPVVTAEGDCVARFLRRAIDLVVDDDYDQVKWQQDLVRYLEAEEVAAYEREEEGIEEYYIVNALRRSLNFGRPM